MPEFTFRDQIEHGEWFSSDEVIEQEHGVFSGAQTGTFTYQGATTQYTKQYPFNWFGTGRYQQGAASTPPLPHDAQTADQQAAVNEAISLALSGAPSNSNYSNSTNGANIMWAWLADTDGMPGWPINHNRPFQAHYGGQTSSQWFTIKPEIGPPYGPPVEDWPDDAIDFEWERDPDGTYAWRYDGATVEWSVEMRVRVKNDDVNLRGDLTSTGSLNIILNRTTLETAERARQAGAQDYDTNWPLPPHSVLGSTAQSMTASTVGAPLDTSGRAYGSVRYSGTRELSAAELNGSYQGHIGFRLVFQSGSMILPYDAGAATAEPGWLFTGWRGNADTGIAWQANALSDGLPCYVRVTYRMRPPRMRWIYHRPDSGDGVAPTSLSAQSQVTDVYGVINGHGYAESRLLHWTPGGGVTLVDPQQWGRGTGSLTRLGDGRILVIDQAEYAYEQRSLGYTLDANLGDYRPWPAYPVGGWEAMAPPRGAGLEYRHENDRVWIASYIFHDEYYGYDNSRAWTSRFIWHEFSPDGQDLRHVVDRERLWYESPQLTGTVYANGQLFFRDGLDQIVRYSPQTGEIHIARVGQDWYLLGGTSSELVVWDSNYQRRDCFRVPLNSLDWQVARFEFPGDELPLSAYARLGGFKMNPVSGYGSSGFPEYAANNSKESTVVGNTLYYVTHYHPDTEGYALIAADLTGGLTGGDPSELIDPYALTTYGGVTVDRMTAAALLMVEAKVGHPLTMTQGSYNAGGVSASAGTHDGGGVVDLAYEDVDNVLLAAREVGFAAWGRTPDEGPWPSHIHMVLVGNERVSPVAEQQIWAYKAGLNGLASGAPDSFYWRPDPIPTFGGRSASPWWTVFDLSTITELEVWGLTNIIVVTGPGSSITGSPVSSTRNYWEK